MSAVLIPDIDRFSVEEILLILDNPTDVVPENHGCFRIMTPQDGDRRLAWDRNNMDQIARAKEEFDRLIVEGMVAYRVGVDGHRSSEIMTEFDPYADEVIFMPMAMIRGG